MVKIGINGFGRIGRCVARIIHKRLKETKCTNPETPLLVHINDPFLKPDHMAHLLKYDSTHGTYEGEVTCAANQAIKIDGHVIEVSNERQLDKIPWKKSCTDYVVDATGLYKSQATAEPHFKDGAVKRVLITAPGKEDVPMFVFGVNHDCYNNEMRIVSNASCTTNCLAPLLKVVHDNFKIVQAIMITVHAVTPSQNILDGSAKKNFRIGRGGIQNIIPTSTGAAKAIAHIVPELKGKVTGNAARVPVSNGSMIDVTMVLQKGADFDVIKSTIKEASETCMSGILAYTEEQIVSCDVIGNTNSSIFDAGASLALNKNFVKLVSWYDNEWGYASRVVDMLKYMASRECN